MCYYVGLLLNWEYSSSLTATKLLQQMCVIRLRPYLRLRGARYLQAIQDGYLSLSVDSSKSVFVNFKLRLYYECERKSMIDGKLF